MVGDSILVTLRWTKTNQFGEHMTFSLPRIESMLCPVYALTRMWGLVPAKCGVCFRHINGEPFTYNQFHTMLRKSLTLQGYAAEAYSSHGLRRAGTTFAFLSGVPTELINLWVLGEQIVISPIWSSLLKPEQRRHN